MASLQKLFDLLPFIESSCPAGDFAVTMEPPTLETLKEREERLAMQINNQTLLLRSGAIEPQEAALNLGLLKWADEERLADFLDGPEPEVNPNDPNQTQQTRAAISSMNKGKSPSNNPSGQKGNTPDANE